MTTPPELEARIRLQLRALEEVALAQSATVSVLFGDGEQAGERFGDALEEAALDGGFAVARADLGEHGLHGLHAVVQALAQSVRTAATRSTRKRTGLVSLLDAFAATHGRRALAQFDARAEELGAFGPLTRLAREHLEAASVDGRGRALVRWLSGESAAAADSDDPRPLSPANARSGLAAFTRLVSVLGARGTLIKLDRADALTDLSPARRDAAYTVLRELVDDGDGLRGMLGTRVVLLGSRGLADRKHALRSHEALATRLDAPAEGALPVPHATWVDLDVPLPHTPLEPELPSDAKGPSLRALLRLGQGLPPLDATSDLTVGLETMDARIDALFELASHDGSGFATLVGEYGAGKTHLLVHLTARALADKRPVMRLTVERLDEDLGNPQRHLRRLLEHTALPFRGRPSPLERLELWLSRDATQAKLTGALRAVAATDTEAARVAGRIAPLPIDALDPERVSLTLGCADLLEKPAAPGTRREAYARLLLWIELLERMDGCAGPVLLLDEAENLYRPGISRAERRTALRSLGFYCGGSLPRACVVLAVTPETLAALREESGALLDELDAQVTALACEDVTMLRRRLLRAKPMRVEPLDRAQLEALAEKARALHAKARGRTRDPLWDAWLDEQLDDRLTPRALLRAVVDRLERLAFFGS